MSSISPEEKAELRMDPAQLYREEIFTDQRVGTIRRLSPVRADGSDDPARTVQFVGQAQIMTPMGPVPLSFELPGPTLQEAVAAYPQAAEAAVERAAQELQEMRREAASSIMVPGGGAGGGMGGAGGMPGGGGIQLP